MLQEKKKYTTGCIKLMIFIGIIGFLIVSGLFIVLIFLGFAFIGGNKNKKNKINYEKIFQYIGVYDCIKHFLGDFKQKGDKSNYGSKGTKIDNYLERMNRSIKKRAEELKEKEEFKKVKKVEKTEMLWEREEREQYNKNKKIDRDNLLTEGFSPLKKHRPKPKNNSFNNGKSIWDDYESVIDIMKRNK